MSTLRVLTRIVPLNDMYTSDSGYIVGSARPGDLPAIRALLTSAGLPTMGVDDLMSEFVVARPAPGTDAAPVAAGAVEPRADAGLLRSLVVHPDARGLGLGRTITAALIDSAAARRVAALYLLTETAESFFARVGFEPVARHDAPESIRSTDEFRSLCPDSAVLMRLVLAETTPPTS